VSSTPRGQVSLGRGLVILAAGVGVIASFVNWYGVSSAAGGSLDLNGWHGWGVLAAILFIVAGVISVARVLGVAYGSPGSESLLLVIVGLVAVIAVIIFMLTQGSGYGAGYKKGPLVGAYIGLVCAIVIALGGVLLQREATSGSRRV